MTVLAAYTIDGLRLPSVANLREHWSKRAKRTKSHRTLALAYTRAALRAPLPPGRLDVSLVRIAPRALDSDNLASACKGLRDGIADALGIDDGDRRLTWSYGQRKGAPRQYGVQVAVVAVGASQSAPQPAEAGQVRPANENAPEGPSRPGNRYPRRRAAVGITKEA